MLHGDGVVGQGTMDDIIVSVAMGWRTRTLGSGDIGQRKGNPRRRRWRSCEGDAGNRNLYDSGHRRDSVPMWTEDGRRGGSGDCGHGEVHSRGGGEARGCR
jgi:hypothetical protein